jgi:hypothetical protein
MLTEERKKEYLEKQMEDMEMNFFKNTIAKELYERKLKAAGEDEEEEMLAIKNQIKDAARADIKNQIYFEVLKDFRDKM